MPGHIEFMKKAFKVAELSNDRFKKVGIVAVDDKQRIISFGHNYIGNKKDEIMLNREERRIFCVHAEIDLLHSLRPDEKIHTVYTTLFPCVHCMTALVTLRIKRIIYAEMYDKDRNAMLVAQYYNIDFKEYKPTTLEKGFS